MAAWRCISLAIMAYRQGYAPTAKAWCEKCLSYPGNNPPRIATAHIIQAMACHQLGENEEALSELDQGRNPVETEFSKDLDEGGGAQGFWYDWLFARILLREAEGLIQTPPATPK